MEEMQNYACISRVKTLNSVHLEEDAGKRPVQNHFSFALITAFLVTFLNVSVKKDIKNQIAVNVKEVISDMMESAVFSAVPTVRIARALYASLVTETLRCAVTALNLM